mmetsp:Transcript_65428/g.120632  ORF Transcript_65428/g.120632 Transcript_65428/m.120632 type:complete len:91 (+) Transcript_65428:160-432(+)
MFQSSRSMSAGGALATVEGVRNMGRFGEAGCDSTDAALALLTSINCQGPPLTLPTRRRPSGRGPMFGVGGAVMVSQFDVCHSYHKPRPPH